MMVNGVFQILIAIILQLIFQYSSNNQQEILFKTFEQNYDQRLTQLQQNERNYQQEKMISFENHIQQKSDGLISIITNIQNDLAKQHMKIITLQYQQKFSHISLFARKQRQSEKFKQEIMKLKNGLDGQIKANEYFLLILNDVKNKLTNDSKLESQINSKIENLSSKFMDALNRQNENFLSQQRANIQDLNKILKIYESDGSKELKNSMEKHKQLINQQFLLYSNKNEVKQYLSDFRVEIRSSISQYEKNLQNFLIAQDQSNRNFNQKLKTLQENTHNDVKKKQQYEEIIKQFELVKSLMLTPRPQQPQQPSYDFKKYKQIEKFDYYDLNDKSLDLTSNKKGVYFSKMSTSSYKPVFSSDPLQKNLHRMKIKITSFDDGQQFYFGISTFESIDLRRHPIKHIGYYKNSYGYDSKTGCIVTERQNKPDYGPPLKEGDTIEILVDLNEKTISYIVNDIDKGVAFRNLQVQTYYAGITFTGNLQYGWASIEIIS